MDDIINAIKEKVLNAGKPYSAKCDICDADVEVEIVDVDNDLDLYLKTVPCENCSELKEDWT
jgi:hypothetical protein